MSKDKDILPGRVRHDVTAEHHPERLVSNEPLYPILAIEELPPTPDQRYLLPYEKRQYLRPEEKVVHIHEPEHIWPRRNVSAHEVVFKAMRARTADELGRKGPVVASVNIGEDDSKLSRYETEHGRDAVEAGKHLYPLYPQVLDSVVVSLAESQGVMDEPYIPGLPHRQEKVGSIILVNRHPDDPLARKFRRRLGWEQPFYGSADGPGLFVNAVYKLHRRDSGYLKRRQFRPRDMGGTQADISLAFERSVKWLEENADQNDGLIAYKNPIKAGGIRNQGWRDSANAMIHKDGWWASDEYGIAPIEIQGEAFDAFRHAAEIYREFFNDTAKADELDERARRLLTIVKENGFKNGRFVSGFDWDDSRSLRPIDTTTSAAGRFLGSEIAKLNDPEMREMVDQTVKRLFQEDMLTKWGLRTLAASEDFYVPWVYHNGVWKYDTDNIAANLSALGFYGLDRILGALTTAQYSKTGVFYEHVSGDDSENQPIVPGQDIYVFNEIYQELYLWMQTPPPGQTWSATSEIAKSLRYRQRPQLRATDSRNFAVEKNIWDLQISDDIKSTVYLYSPELALSFAA